MVPRLGVGWAQGGALQPPSHRCRQVFAETRGNKPALCLRMAWGSVFQNPLCAQFLEIMALGVHLLAFMKISLCPVLTSSSGCSKKTAKKIILLEFPFI